MAETSDETQRLKRIAAAAYDYDNDSRWADYWSNVLVPPHLASRPDVVDHFKRKFYQRYIDPDLAVETVFASSSTSQPVRPSASSPSTSGQTQAQSSGSATRNLADTAGPNPTSLRREQSTVYFSVNAWVLISALFALLPFVPRSLFHQAYRYSVLGTACSSLISIYFTCGAPRAWELQTLQVYFQSVIAAKDFINFIYCLTFVASNLCLKFALIPIVCGVLEHVAKFLRRNCTHLFLYSKSDAILMWLFQVGLCTPIVRRKCLVGPCNWVESHTTTLSIMSSNVEITLGFLLIISLFSWQRNLVQTFMYWQLLKLMYHFPTTAGYHQSAWAKIGRRVNPCINRFPRFLKAPISAAQRWWVR